VLNQQFQQLAASEGRAAGEQVIERAAQAVDVRTDVRGGGVQDLLGGHEIRSAQHSAGTGEIRPHRQRASGVRHLDQGFLRAQLRQAEVEHLHGVLLPFASENQIRRLHIAVGHSPLMSVLQPLRHLPSIDAGVHHGQRPS